MPQQIVFQAKPGALPDWVGIGPTINGVSRRTDILPGEVAGRIQTGC